MANLEAEAAFLGAVMIDNQTLEYVGDLEPDDFAEPVHQRIYERILGLRANGDAASPITLMPYFERDDDLSQLGGKAYLARLTGDGQGLLAPRELAAQIRNSAIRRRRLKWLDAERAACADTSIPLTDIVPPSDVTSAGKRLECLDLAALANLDPQPKKFVVARLFPVGETTIFTGPGAVGKSLFAQQLATALAAGTPTLGLKLEQAPAIYVTCEDEPDQLHWRQTHICSALGVEMGGLAGSLHLLSLRGTVDTALATFDNDGRLNPHHSTIA